MTRPASQLSILSLGEALGRLGSSGAYEDFATLTGEQALVVDLPSSSAASSAASRAKTAAVSGAQHAVAEFRQRLRQLACPTIAIVAAELSPQAKELASDFDVVVRSSAELEPVLEAIRQHPQASLALVQLLRHNEQLDMHEGLIAESLVYSVLQSGPEFAAWARERKRRTPPPGVGPAVEMQRDGDHLCLVLNRPARHNAFSSEIRDALVEGLRLAADDVSITAVRLSGRGPSFCSGGDLDEFGSFPDPATAHAIRSTRSPARMLSQLADRARAVVHGACIGAGVELPAFVSHVRAHEDAYFQLPEVAMGLVPGAGGSVSLLRRIGRQRTAWLALTGEQIRASKALEWGLVDEIFSGDPG